MTTADSAAWPQQGPVPRTTPVTAPARPLPPLTTAQKLLLPLGAVLFEILFWDQYGGLNMLLFTLFVVGAHLLTLPKYLRARRSAAFWLTAAGAVFSGAMVALYGSGAAQLACVASLAIFLGYLNQPALKLAAYALLTALANLVQVVPDLVRRFEPPSHVGQRLGRGWFYGRLLLVPLLILGLFHVLFVFANPRYDALSDRALQQLGHWLSLLFSSFSVPHVLFFLLGLVLTTGALLVTPITLFIDHESRFGEFIQRQRDRVASFAVRRPNFDQKDFRALDLRKEYLAALAVFGLVNLLLLVVNLIDIQWIWFGFVPTPGFDLTQFVHEGTYVLILSILVAMGIVLWFFRRNLNFYQPGLRWLRVGATVWVVQNVVLAVSVALRNYYYIYYTGLAYKRIGVCLFLLLTLFGLVTILLKVWQRRSAFSLVRLNAWAMYAVLLLLAAGNWEIWIARYNLQPRFHHIDIGFLLRMPGRVLPTVQAHRAALNTVPQLQAADTYDHYAALDPTTAQRWLDRRTTTWLADYEANASWQNWSYASWQAYQQLAAQKSAARPAVVGR